MYSPFAMERFMNDLPPQEQAPRRPIMRQTERRESYIDRRVESPYGDWVADAAMLRIEFSARAQSGDMLGAMAYFKDYARHLHDWTYQELQLIYAESDISIQGEKIAAFVEALHTESAGLQRLQLSRLPQSFREKCGELVFEVGAYVDALGELDLRISGDSGTIPPDQSGLSPDSSGLLAIEPIE